MKYGVDGLKRKRTGVEKSSGAATTSSSPPVESSPTISEAAAAAAELPPSTSGSVSPSVSEASGEECILDHDLLDCSICIERLQSPIFQCQNGHVACASCCKSTKNVCPSCQHPTGAIRCLVLEKLIESLKAKCANSDSGCPARVKYSDRDAHEKICFYGSVSCPFKNCDFHDLPYNLFEDHVGEKHLEHYFVLIDDAPDGIKKILLKPKDRFFIVFSTHLCFVLHRNPVDVKVRSERSLGDMCYISVLKVLSEQYAGDNPFQMKLKTVSPDGDGLTSTFTMESTCSIDDDDPEDYLRDDAFVFVAQNVSIEVDIEFFPHGHS